MGTLLQIITQGLGVSAILLLGALGLTIVYGVMNVVNLAHGQFVMLGAYVMVIFSPVSPWLGVLAAPVIVAAIGVVADAVVVRHFYGNPVGSMLGTYGLGLVLSQGILLLFGAEQRYAALPVTGSVPIGFGQQYSTWRGLLIVASLAVAGGLYLVLTRTAFGLRIRVVTADRDIASSLGMRPGRVNRAAFALGCGLAGLAGAFAAPFASVSPNMGGSYLVNAFLVVILAGLGNVPSTAIWAVAIGLASAGVSILLNDVMSVVLTWSVALCVVAARRRSIEPVRV